MPLSTIILSKPANSVGSSEDLEASDSNLPNAVCGCFENAKQRISDIGIHRLAASGLFVGTVVASALICEPMHHLYHGNAGTIFGGLMITTGLTTLGACAGKLWQMGSSARATYEPIADHVV